MAPGIDIVIILICGSAARITCYSGESFELNKEHLNKALIGHSVLKINGSSHHECARNCMSVTICKSIDYDRKERTCKLNDVESSSVDLLEFETKIGSIFSDISEWPSTMMGACQSNPCQTNQRCYENDKSYLCRDLFTCSYGKKIDNGILEMVATGVHKFCDVALVKCDDGFVTIQKEVRCLATGQWQTASCHQFTDCKDIHDVFPEAQSGLYDIVLWQSGTILTVNCDMETAGGGWTIFHRRLDGSVEFYRNFKDYENGFGNADGEFWLGLKYIQELAEQGPTELRVDMTKETGVTGHETFQDFKLTDGTKYRLNIGSRSSIGAGSEERGLKYHNLKPFSTFDRDLDSVVQNCAVERHGAWWYKNCGYVNLNGYYAKPGATCNITGAAKNVCGHVHVGFNNAIALKSSAMMLRRV
ncbi:fibrinogen-like protein A [Ruditapes philippinarum]|uniref:fibrinogen-like protein A n=1 Tax=Ruditapes philippinarum TaxID=129788 RepID=UPI00295AB9BE|nr:fibrinogen-like protein A [Ruditapes philippinarum]